MVITRKDVSPSLTNPVRSWDFFTAGHCLNPWGQPWVWHLCCWLQTGWTWSCNTLSQPQHPHQNCRKNTTNQMDFCGHEMRHWLEKYLEQSLAHCKCSINCTYENMLGRITLMTCLSHFLHFPCIVGQGTGERRGPVQNLGDLVYLIIFTLTWKFLISGLPQSFLLLLAYKGALKIKDIHTLTVINKVQFWKLKLRENME